MRYFASRLSVLVDHDESEGKVVCFKQRSGSFEALVYHKNRSVGVVLEYKLTRKRRRINYSLLLKRFSY